MRSCWVEHQVHLLIRFTYPPLSILHLRLMMAMSTSQSLSNVLSIQQCNSAEHAALSTAPFATTATLALILTASRIILWRARAYASYLNDKATTMWMDGTPMVWQTIIALMYNTCDFDRLTHYHLNAAFRSMSTTQNCINISLQLHWLEVLAHLERRYQR